MTFLTESNEDARSVTPDAAATGPLTGFLESFRTSVDVQMRTSAQFGIEYFMHEQDWQQTKSMLDAGVENPPQLMMSLEGSERGEGTQSVAQMLRRDSGFYEDFIPERSGEYLDVAKRHSGQDVSPEFEERLQAYDAEVLKLSVAHPNLDLRTSRQMFDTVKERAVAAEQTQQAARRTWGGTAGDFLGGALSSMHPGTDPLNFYSLGIGGAGKTVAQRILFQTGAQGAVETVNQITGVQEERELLGLTHGFADAAQRVGAAALGGGALQGAGEVVAAGARRMFRKNTAIDPSPPVPAQEPLALPHPDQFKEEAQAIGLEQNGRSYIDMLADQTPLSGIRVGRPRAVADIADISRQLEDWGGGNPVDARPRTADVTFPDDIGTSKLDTRATLDGNRMYQMAKEADPAIFNKYDGLLERKNTYQRWLDELASERNADVQATVEIMDERAHMLEAKLRTTQGKNNKAKIKADIKEVNADRASLLEVSKTTESPDVARVRGELLKLDEKMRDIAPLISRAYARVRGRWGDTHAEVEAVWSAYREGQQKPEMPSTNEVPDFDTAMSLTDRAPIMRGADRVEPGTTSTITAQRIVAKNAEIIDEALDTYRTEAKRLVDVTEEGKLRVDGNEYEFDLDTDKMFVPHEDGTGGKEVTIREYLDQIKKSEEELEAVSTCSIR